MSTGSFGRVWFSWSRHFPPISGDNLWAKRLSACLGMELPNRWNSSGLDWQGDINYMQGLQRCHQGSVLGPLLFTLYVVDISGNIKSYDLGVHFFANDGTPVMLIDHVPGQSITSWASKHGWHPIALSWIPRRQSFYGWYVTQTHETQDET